MLARMEVVKQSHSIQRTDTRCSLYVGKVLVNLNVPSHPSVVGHDAAVQGPNRKTVDGSVSAACVGM